VRVLPLAGAVSHEKPPVPAWATRDRPARTQNTRTGQPRRP